MPPRVGTWRNGCTLTGAAQEWSRAAMRCSAAPAPGAAARGAGPHHEPVHGRGVHGEAAVLGEGVLLVQHAVGKQRVALREAERDREARLDVR